MSFVPPFSFLSFHSYLTHFHPHPTLSNTDAFSDFELINAPLVFFFAFPSLLTLSFFLSLRLSPGSLPPVSPARAQFPLAALTPAEGNSGFSWAPCWQWKGARAPLPALSFPGGLSSWGGWETHLPPWATPPPAAYLLPETWTPFTPPPKGSQFTMVTDSTHFSLLFFLFVNFKSDVTTSHQSIGLWVWKPHFVNIQKWPNFFFMCICICWLNASFHQSNETSMVTVSFVLLLAIKPLAGAVYIFICLIATYLHILNSSYSSLFSNLGQESSFINTHCHNQWISLAVEAGGHAKIGVLHMDSPTDHSSPETEILGAYITLNPCS